MDLRMLREEKMALLIRRIMMAENPIQMKVPQAREYIPAQMRIPPTKTDILTRMGTLLIQMGKIQIQQTGKWTMRLNKYISGAGICSRREADRLIESGRVTVDGRKAESGMQVTEENDVRIGKKRIRSKEEKIVLAVYKPAGIVCTEDMRERKNIIRFLDYPVRVTYAGRLDKDSEGLLIMTNDGDLINSMMRARHRHEKEYKVTVNRPVTDEFIEKLKAGVRITDKEKGLDAVTLPCRAKKTGKYTFSIVLTQGLNRQIRRMCEALGYKVERLIRIRILNIELGKMKSGEVRRLTEQELKEIDEQTKGRQDEGAGGAS